MSLCCRLTFVSGLTEDVAVNISLSLPHRLSLCRRKKKKKEMMSSVSTHLKILQPRSISGPSVHISLDMQALVASFRQTRLAEWYRTFFDVLHLPAMFDRDPFPNWGATTGKWSPQKNQNNTDCQYYFLFSKTLHWIPGCRMRFLICCLWPPRKLSVRGDAVYCQILSEWRAHRHS